MSSNPPTPPKPTGPDWAAIELDYRTGIKPLRLIAEQNGISHVTIFKRAKRDEWTRDLSKKIKAREDEIVERALVNRTASSANRNKSRVSPVTERRHIEVLAHTKATIRLELMQRHERMWKSCESLLGDFEVTNNPEGQGLIEALMDAASEPKEDETAEQTRIRRKKTRDALDRALTVQDRTDTFKRIVESHEKITRMVREAYGIGEEEDEKPLDSLAEVLRSFQGRSMLPVVERVD